MRTRDGERKQRSTRFKLLFYKRIQHCLDASQQARQWSPGAPEVFAAAQFRRGGADLRQQGKTVALEIYAFSPAISDGFAVDGRVRRPRHADALTFCVTRPSERCLAATRANVHSNLPRLIRCQ
jgi:hypothetical protein